MKYMGLICLILLSIGCKRYVCFFEQSFLQAHKTSAEKCLAHAYVRSTARYDRFVTVALVDAIWVARPVQDYYVARYGNRWGLTDAQREALRQKIDKEHHEEIEFYVLWAPDDKNNIISLTNSKAQWSAVLEVDGVAYAPSGIKRVELDPEYAALFGKSYTQFKGVYRIIFDARDIQEHVIITEQTRCVVLRFYSERYEVSLAWDLPIKEDHECADSYRN